MNMGKHKRMPNSPPLRGHMTSVPVEVTSIENQEIDLVDALVTRAEEHAVRHINGEDDDKLQPKCMWTAKLCLELAQLFLDVDSKR